MLYIYEYVVKLNLLVSFITYGGLLEPSVIKICKDVCLLSVCWLNLPEIDNILNSVQFSLGADVFNQFLKRSVGESSVHEAS